MNFAPLRAFSMGRGVTLSAKSSNVTFSFKMGVNCVTFSLESFGVTFWEFAILIFEEMGSGRMLFGEREEGEGEGEREGKRNAIYTHLERKRDIRRFS